MAILVIDCYDGVRWNVGKRMNLQMKVRPPRAV